MKSIASLVTTHSPNLLSRLILRGEMPGLVWLKKIVWWAAFVAPFSVLIEPDIFRDLGENGWWLLTFVLFIRPLADLFPEFSILRIGVMCRKEAGLLAGTLLLAHGLGFFLVNQLSITTTIFDPDFWTANNMLAWGMAGTIASVPVILTTNMWSMRFFGRWWKWIQQLTYVFFFLGNVHIALIGKVDDAIIASVAVIVLWFLAHFGVTFRPLTRLGIVRNS